MPFLRSYQKVILVGNVTRDPVLRYTANNTPVARFTVATNRSFVNAAGEKKEETHFHPIVVWGKFAEKIASILKKGDKVYVEGRLEYRQKRSDEGQIIATEASIRADEIVILQRSSKRSLKPQEGGEVDEEAKELDLDEIAKELAEEGNNEEAEENQKENETDENPEEELPF